MSKKKPAGRKAAKAKKPKANAASPRKRATKRAGSARTARPATRAAGTKSAKPSTTAAGGSSRSHRTATSAGTNGKALATGRQNPRRGANPPASASGASAVAASESPRARKGRAGRIVAELHRLYPNADCALDHISAFELLVATILSAQSTDETVNKVTPVLFERYPTPASLAEAAPGDVEKIIHATGFFRQKTRSIIGMAKRVVEDFGGDVPDTMEALVTLPGVARKTANVVLGTHFRKNVGVVVDTHIGRLAHRLALTWRSKNDKDAVRIENDLMEVLPRDEWTFVGHALIWHGRRVCSARKPDCKICTLSPHCPSAETFG